MRLFLSVLLWSLAGACVWAFFAAIDGTTAWKSSPLLTGVGCYLLLLVGYKAAQAGAFYWSRGSSRRS